MELPSANLASLAFETKEYFSKIEFLVPDMVPSLSITAICISSFRPPRSDTYAEVPGTPLNPVLAVKVEKSELEEESKIITRTELPFFPGYFAQNSPK